MKELLNSKKYAPIIYTIGLLFVALIIFLAGIFVGYHKAQFSAQFGDRYYNAFGKHMNSPITMMGGPDADDLVSGHGAAGKVISVNFPNILVSDATGLEKSIIINNETIIRSARESIASTSVRLNDFIIVIGTPNSRGQIDARLIRIMPPPMMFATTSTSTFPIPPRINKGPGMMYPQ